MRPFGEEVAINRTQTLVLGLQVLGRRWDDKRLLSIAQMLPELMTGFRRPPGY